MTGEPLWPRYVLAVTAIGKPYKVPLRAGAAREVFIDALAGYPDVTVYTDNGTPALTVTLADPTRRDDVDRQLSRYAVTYRVITAA